MPCTTCTIVTHTPTARRPAWPPALLACAALALCLAALPHAAQARGKTKSDGDGNTSTNQSAAKKGSVKIKHQRSSSEETRAERDRRLYRECKGLPNAGACAGYTQR
jgi:hypothetical protein